MAGFENTLKKYPSKLDSNVILKVYEGHFATVEEALDWLKKEIHL